MYDCAWSDYDSVPFALEQLHTLSDIEQEERCIRLKAMRGWRFTSPVYRPDAEWKRTTDSKTWFLVRDFLGSEFLNPDGYTGNGCGPAFLAQFITERKNVGEIIFANLDLEAIADNPQFKAIRKDAALIDAQNIRVMKKQAAENTAKNNQILADAMTRYSIAACHILGIKNPADIASQERDDMLDLMEANGAVLPDVAMWLAKFKDQLVTNEIDHSRDLREVFSDVFGAVVKMRSKIKAA